MEYDTDKVDDAVLALLVLTLGANGFEDCAWKGHDWDALNRLYEKGFIADPRNKNKSVVLTEEGLVRSKQIFEEHFGSLAPKRWPNPRCAGREYSKQVIGLRQRIQVT